MPNIRKAYKVLLKTNRDIETQLVRFCGSARFVWNKCLACVHEQNADVNAAKNILTVGQTGMAYAE